jgi:MFS family permease
MTDPVTPTEERWLTPGVRGIGTASFLADAGHEIPTALLPNLLTVTLGAPAAALGLIEGIAVLSSLIGAATTIWQVGILRAGAWAARGLRVPARNALLADIVPAAVYGRAYGFERAMDNLGAIAGPLLALALVGLVGVRTAIALSIIPGLLAALAIVYAIRHAPRAEQRERQPLRLRIRPVLTGRCWSRSSAARRAPATGSRCRCATTRPRSCTGSRSRICSSAGSEHATRCCRRRSRAGSSWQSPPQQG